MFSSIFKKDGSKGKSAQTSQDGRPVVTVKQNFATLTIADLQKVDKNVPYISNPIKSTATRNGIPIATSPTVSSVSEASGSLQPPLPAAQSSLSLHPGASRDILQNSVQTPIDGKAESCAASIVSPGGRSWTPVTPMSETGDDISPIMSRRPAKHTTQLPTIVDENVDEGDYEDNPFADGNASMRIFPPGQTPRLPISRGTSVADPFNDRQTLTVNTETKTPRLRALYTSFWPGQYTGALSPYVKSATPVSAVSRTHSRWNPFGHYPQEQQLGNNLREQGRRPPSPSEYSLRYSDCGRNPFDGLDEDAIRERDSSGVGNLWNMILSRKRSKANLSEPPTPATALTRNVTGVSAVSANDDLFNYYTQTQQPTTPHPATVKHSSNVLVDYDGRPSTRNLTVRAPLLKVSEPYQLQSPSEEYDDVSKQHIMRLEAEIAELKRWKEIQQDREKNKEIIQRQLESERELAELRRTMEAQEIARRLKQQQQQQQNESPVSPEFDRKRNNGNGFPADRRSMETVATVATQWPSGIEESPMPSSSHQFHPSLKELRDCYIRNAQGGSVSPVPASEFNFPNDNKSRNALASSSHETAGSPSQRPREIGVPETPCEVMNGKGVDGDISNIPQPRTSELPPPYSRNPIKNFQYWRKSRNAGQHVRMDSHDSAEVDTAPVRDDSNPQGGSRFPVKPSSLPKLTITTDEDSLHMPPKQLTLPYNSPQMKFTPTTPHLARSETYPNRQFRPVQQVTLTSMGLAGKRPHELRDEAEKKRKRQEKRERLLGRGGWCWLCGLCCGPRKMSKKQKWCWVIFFLILIIVGIVFGVLHAVKSKAKRAQEIEDDKAPQFITIRNFPPMPVGNLTATPRRVQRISTCTTPPTLWSCSLPPPVGKGESQDMPILQWLITPSNGSSIRLRDQAPSPPSIADYRNFSSLDGITEGPLEGEETDFLASMMIGAISAHAEKPDPQPLQRRSHPRDILNRRQDSSETESLPSSSTDTPEPSSTSSSSSDDSEDPSFTSAPRFTLDPEPSFSATATDEPVSSTAVASSSSPSATATDFPTIPEDPEIPDSPTEGKPHLFPESYVAQPLRFFNRGQADEHYGFSTYFSKIIYLRSIDAVGPDGNNPLDSFGGVPPSEARWVCKWPQTRYVVKIFTNSKKQSDGKVKVIVDPASLAVDKSKYAGGLGGYPVTVEEDRAGTHTKGQKSIGRCWPIDERGNLSPVGWKFIPEFNNGINAGGDKGKGCQCVWNNWKEVNADEL